MADYCISDLDINKLESLITVLATDIHANELRQLHSNRRRNTWAVGEESFPHALDINEINYRHAAIITLLDETINRIKANRLDLVTHDDYPDIIPAPIQELDRFADLDLTDD